MPKDMDMFFDDDLPIGTKQPRATGSSATSRKSYINAKASNR